MSRGMPGVSPSAMGTQVSMYEYDPMISRDRRRLRLLALLSRLPLA